MQNLGSPWPWLAGLAFAVGLTASGAKAGGAPESAADPFAYCAAVGTVDLPDDRYTGEPMPDAVVAGLVKATGLSSDAPVDWVAGGSHWRCLDGKVQACFRGANLPCLARVDLSTEPTAAMTEFCRENPDTEVVPAAVAGRETAYDWRCQTGRAVVGRQLVTPDSAGFVSEIWHEIPPSSAD